MICSFRTRLYLVVLFLFLAPSVGADPWDSARSHDIPGETILAASRHFEVRAKPVHDDGTPNNPVYTPEQLQRGLTNLEEIWSFFHGPQIGFMEPHAADAVKYRVRVYLYQTIHGLFGGADQWGPAMWLGVGALADRWGLAHEYTHGLHTVSGGLRGSQFTGWFWESHANWMAHQFIPSDPHCSEMLVNFPYLYYGSTRNMYCNWQFLEHLKEEHGVAAINRIWTESLRERAPGWRDETPFTALMRNMGWTVADLNDEFGRWALRNVTWDYANGAVYRSRYGSYDDRHKLRRNRVAMLDTLERVRRRFIVPSYWAPQPLGYNLVRLFPDSAGRDGRVTVRFRGVPMGGQNPSWGDFALQPSALPEPAPDFRWGLVAVDQSGSPRYSSLQSGMRADLTFDVRSGDRALWLVVVATPATYTRIFWNQVYYSIWRYPWMVELEGALPEGHQAGAWDPPAGVTGRRHPNGGGWVASTATVDASAWVGPGARVLDRARVLGNARLEGNATVGGTATVEQGALIRDQARVLGTGRVSGRAVVDQHASVYAGVVTDSARVGALSLVDGGTVRGAAQMIGVMNALGAGRTLEGTAQLRGDMELNTAVLRRGVFYGIVGDVDTGNVRMGAARSSPMLEAVPPLSAAMWPDQSSLAGRLDRASSLPRLRSDGWFVPGDGMRWTLQNASGRIVATQRIPVPGGVLLRSAEERQVDAVLFPTFR